MKRVKDIIKSICIILFVLGYVTSTLYNGSNTLFVNIIDFISKPIVYPILLFLIGMSIYEDNYSTKKLLKYSFYSFIISLFINIFCFAIIFFIQKENALVLEYLLKTNIFTFISLAYLFFILVKKLELESQTLWGLGLLFSIVNTVLTVKYQFNSNVVLGSLTSIIYSSANYSSFSFLAWIIFPITGYIYSQIIENKKNKFYFFNLLISLTVYIAMLCYSKYVVNGGPLIDFNNPHTFYHMNVYGGLMNISLCVFLYSLSYFVSKKIPGKINRHIKRWSKNIIIIYLVSLLFINYIFLLILGDLIKMNIVETLLLFALVFIISDVISYIINKKFINKQD